MDLPELMASLFNKQQPAQQQQQPAMSVNKPDSMAAQQQQQQATGGMPPQQDGQQQQQANPEGQQATPAPQADDNNPLAAFANMFDNTQKEGEENLPPQFALTPEALNKAASSIDFTKGVDPELLAKLGEGDLSQLPALLNHVAQQAYSQSLSHGSALTDQFVGQYSKYQAEQVAPLVRQQLTDQALTDSATGENTHIDLSNPVVKQAVQATATMLQQKNPTMSPSEIASMAKDYHIQLAATMLGADGNQLAKLPELNQQHQQQQQEAETNWDEYLG